MKDDEYDVSEDIIAKFDVVPFKFQFNYYLNDSTPDYLFQQLQQDVSQVGFNGSQILTNYSWIQALNTGTFINYRLGEDCSQ